MGWSSHLICFLTVSVPGAVTEEEWENIIKTGMCLMSFIRQRQAKTGDIYWFGTLATWY